MPVLRGSVDFMSLVADLAATPARLIEIADDCADDTLDDAPVGEWSVRIVLAHLRDDEFLVMRPRLARMLAEDRPLLTPFDEKRWAALRYRGRDACDELLTDFRVQRQASASIIRMLTPDQLQRTGVQPELGEFDVHWWLEHWLQHDNDHLAQIRDTLSDPLAPTA